MTRRQQRERAHEEGVQAAVDRKSQNDNPYNPKRAGDDYDVELATMWNHAFCREAYGTEIFDD